MKTGMLLMGVVLLAACRAKDTDGEFPTDQWYCVGDEPEMADRETGRVQYTLPVADSDGAAVPDLTVNVCGDPGCPEELPKCVNDAGQCFEVSGDRDLVFSFPFGFDGVLRFTAPGFVETNYVLGGPMIGTPDGQLEVDGQRLTMASSQSIVNTQRGSLVLKALGCDGQPASGVRVQPVSGSVLSEGPAAGLVTDDQGVVTSDNMQPDAATLAAIAPDGSEYARVTALIRANAVTVAELRIGIGVWGQ